MFNSLGSMPFLALPVVFLIVIWAIFTIWSLKFSDELTTHNIEIKTFINAEIGEINTKIANELGTNEFTTCLSEINASFTVELGKINTELNN